MPNQWRLFCRGFLIVYTSSLTDPPLRGACVWSIAAIYTDGGIPPSSVHIVSGEASPGEGSGVGSGHAAADAAEEVQFHVSNAGYGDPAETVVSNGIQTGSLESGQLDAGVDIGQLAWSVGSVSQLAYGQLLQGSSPRQPQHGGRVNGVRQSQQNHVQQQHHRHRQHRMMVPNSHGPGQYDPQKLSLPHQHHGSRPSSQGHAGHYDRDYSDGSYASSYMLLGVDDLPGAARGLQLGGTMCGGAWAGGEPYPSYRDASDIAESSPFTPDRGDGGGGGGGRWQWWRWRHLHRCIWGKC